MLHQRASAEALGFCRIAVYSIWMYTLLTSVSWRLAVYPVDWYTPLGVMRFVPPSLNAWLLSLPFLQGLTLVSVVLCALLILGVRPFQPLALLFACCVTLNDAMVRSMAGDVNHAQFGIVYASWVLAMFPCADGFSLTPKSNRADGRLYAAPMVLCIVALTFCYAMIGVRRFYHGGMDLFLDDSIPLYLVLGSLQNLNWGFDYGLYAMSSPLLAAGVKAGALVTTGFEVLSPLCLFSHRLRRLWIAVIVPFHVLTWLTMDIFFWENVLLICVFMTMLPHWFAPRPAAPGKRVIVFYDGVCGLCQGFVRFLFKRDDLGIFQFAPLQGATAAEQLPALDDDERNWSVMLSDETGIHQRSDASLRTVSRLGGIWALARLLLIVPRPIRDSIYQAIARHRYRWFGKTDACPIPSNDQRARLLP
jgi:predicted DCC family thiol-disulfide oxidoreductase YuxK